MAFGQRLINTDDTAPTVPINVTSFTFDASQSTILPPATGSFCFNDEGSKMWALQIAASNNSIREYDLSVNFNPSTYTLVTTLPITGMTYGQFAFHIGNYVYAGGYNNGGSAADMHRFELNAGSIVGSTQTTGTGIPDFTNAFNLNATGDKFFVQNLGSPGQYSTQSIYSLSTPFDITSTKTLLGTVNLSSYNIGTTDGMMGQFTSDGNNFVVSMTKGGFPGQSCYLGVLECSTPFDLNTITSLTSSSVDLNASVNQPFITAIKPDNTAVYCYNQFGSDIYVFN